MATGFKRPQTVSASPLAVLQLPLRLFNPPPAPCKARTFQIAPNFQVDLEDVLGAFPDHFLMRGTLAHFHSILIPPGPDNQHLPPLSLKDLESYLLFTEYSAENL